MPTQLFIALTSLMLFFLAILCLVGYQIGRHVKDVGELLAGGLAKLTPPAPTTTDGDQPTVTLRLQACERFTLMLERINVANLLLRLPPAASGTAKEYTAALLLAIRQEFEHNVTQQIYVSDSLWNILLQARDNVSQLIVRAAEGADDAPQVAGRLRLMSSRQPSDPIAMAQSAVRKEATSVLGR